MKNIFFTDPSVKKQIIDLISENSTDSDLERKFDFLTEIFEIWKKRQNAKLLK